MKILVIADPQTCLAFTLAGIAARTVQSEVEVPPLLGNLKREEAGLVLITETLAAENRHIIERILLEPGGPLILEIPDTTGPLQSRGRATERILSLLRR